MTIATRVKKLESLAFHPFSEGECPNPLYGAVLWDAEPEPAEHEVGRCPTCGGRHVLQVIEELVNDLKEGG